MNEQITIQNNQSNCKERVTNLFTYIVIALVKKYVELYPPPWDVEDSPKEISILFTDAEESGGFCTKDNNSGAICVYAWDYERNSSLVFNLAHEVAHLYCAPVKNMPLDWDASTESYANAVAENVTFMLNSIAPLNK